MLYEARSLGQTLNLIGRKKRGTRLKWEGESLASKHGISRRHRRGKECLTSEKWFGSG